MTYSIIKTNGSPIPVIGDAVRDDSSTSLSLVGKNYANYGIVLNENFVHLLENFANATAPISPLEGQLWWNSTAKNLRVYSGDGWKSMVSSTAGAVQPAAPAQGDQWFNTNVNQLRVWNGSTWIAIGPLSNPGVGLTGPVAESVTDTANPPQTHVVVKNYIENQVVSIVSKDATFTPASPLDGFPLISPGVTLSSNYSIAPNAGSLVTKQYVDSGLANVSVTTGSVTPEKLSTGGLYWATNGKVGIGTVSPGTNLEVNRGSEGEYLRVGGDNALNGRSLRFTSSTNDGSNGALHTINAASASGVIAFATSGTERMRVANTGNIGVGTTTPGQKLSVAGIVESTTGGFKFPDGTLQTTAASTSASFVLSDGLVTPAKLSTGGPSWTTSGNLGVGVTSPVSKLDVAGDITLGASFSGLGSQRLNFRGANTDSANIRFDSDSDSASRSSLILETTDNSDEPIVFKQSGATRMAIGNNVGIGTVAPARKLHIVDGTLDTQLLLRASDTTGPQLMLGANTTVGGSVINATSVTGDATLGHLILMTDGNERVRITPTGTVGIGKTAPQTGTKLDVNGVINAAYPSGSSQAFFDQDDTLAPFYTNIGQAGSSYVPAVKIRSGGAARIRISSFGSLHYANGVTETVIHGIDSNNTSDWHWRFCLDGTFASPGSMLTYSDETLKENITVINNGLAKVLALRGVTFNRKGSDVSQCGVIAQEVETVLPEVVTTGPDGIKSVAYGNITGLLIEAIKELKAEVDSLKQQIEILSKK